MTAAIGNILGPMKGARLLLASSVTFQAIVGAASETVALSFIKLFEANDLVDVRPRAIIPKPAAWNGNSVTLDDFESMGALIICIEADPQDVLSRQGPTLPANFLPDADLFSGDSTPSTEELVSIFGHWIDSIVKEMQANSGDPTSGTNPSYLNVTTMSLVGGPARSNFAREGADFCWAKLQLEHRG